jgi:hypothetical protein
MHPFVTRPVAPQAHNALALTSGSAFAPAMRVGESSINVWAGGLGSQAAVRDYADRVNTSIQGFDDEVQANIVSDESPEQLEIDAKKYETAPDWVPGLSTMVSALRAKAQRLRDINAKLTPAQIKARSDFYTAWRTFDSTWTAFYKKIQGFSLTGPSPSDTWDQIESYETHLGNYRSSYAMVTGAPPVTPAPPTATQIAADHTPPPAPAGATLGFMSDTVKIAGGVAVLGLLVYAYAQSRK